MYKNTKLINEYGNNYVRFENRYKSGDDRSIDVCLIEPVTISTQVDFQSAPIATIGDMINKFVNNPILEATNAITGNYQKTIMTDEYSALVLGGNKNVLKFDFKFRTFSNSSVLPGLSTTDKVVRYFNKNALIRQNTSSGVLKSTGQAMAAGVSTMAEMLDILRGTPSSSEISRATVTANEILNVGYSGNKLVLTQQYENAVEAYLKNIIAIDPETGCKITKVKNPKKDPHNESLSSTNARGTRINVNYSGEDYGLMKFNHDADVPITLDPVAFANSMFDDMELKNGDKTYSGSNVEESIWITGLFESKDQKESKERIRAKLLKIAEKAVDMTNDELIDDGTGTMVQRKNMWSMTRQKIENKLNEQYQEKTRTKIEKINDSLEAPLPMFNSDEEPVYQAQMHEILVLPCETWLNVLFPAGVYDYEGEGRGLICVIDRFDYTIDKFNRWCDWTVSASTHTVPSYTG